MLTNMYSFEVYVDFLCVRVLFCFTLLYVFLAIFFPCILIVCIFSFPTTMQAFAFHTTLILSFASERDTWE